MALSDFTLSYMISPIILIGGYAGTGSLPITSIMNAPNYPLGVTSPSSPVETNPNDISGPLTGAASSFVTFNVLPGGTLMKNQIATYPLANQATAANAVITDMLNISLEMLFPATNGLPFSARQQLITALKSSLDQHTALGGWYNVATPAYIYQGALLTELIDGSEGGEGTQPQNRWIWSFEIPLITQAQADAAQATATAKITNQTMNTGNPPGSQPIVTGLGQPSSGITPSLLPVALNPSGTNVTSGSSAGTPSLASVSPIAPGS